jgi:inosose dehydratase
MVMKICVATVSYRGWRGDELEETIKHAYSAGYKFVEVQYISNNLFDNMVREGTRGIVKVLEMLKTGGLKPVAVYCPGFGGLNDEEAHRSAKEISKFIDAAVQLNCEVVVSTDGPRVDGGINRIVTTLKDLEKKIEKAGVKIGLEPHYQNRIEQIEDYDAIFEKIDNKMVGICVDTGHFQSANVDIPKLIKKYPDRVYHVHLKDQKGLKPVPFGEGETDNIGCLRALKEIGYKDYISVEFEVAYGMEIKKEDTPKYVRDARIYIENMFKILDIQKE